MALTINGKRTGRAAHGTDDLDCVGEPLTKTRELEIEIEVLEGYIRNMRQYSPERDLTESEQKLADLKAKLAYGENWEADADAVHKAIGMTDQTCQKCEKGWVSSGKSEDEVETWHELVSFCDCCEGDWQNCQNCHPEGTGNDTADLLADMRGHG